MWVLTIEPESSAKPAIAFNQPSFKIISVIISVINVCTLCESLLCKLYVSKITNFIIIESSDMVAHSSD